MDLESRFHWLSGVNWLAPVRCRVCEFSCFVLRSLTNSWSLFVGTTPRKINMEPKKHPIEIRKIIFQTIIFRFHVNLPGCSVVFWVQPFRWLEWTKAWFDCEPSLGVAWVRVTRGWNECFTGKQHCVGIQKIIPPEISHRYPKHGHI